MRKRSASPTTLDVISYGDLLDVHFATHDPTQLNRQGNDVGTQYRSALFPLSAEQEAEAHAAIQRAQGDQSKPIVTSIEQASTWYPAEDYHQDYWETEGRSNPYCLAVIPPKLDEVAERLFADRVTNCTTRSSFSRGSWN